MRWKLRRDTDAGDEAPGTHSREQAPAAFGISRGRAVKVPSCVPATGSTLSATTGARLESDGAR
jgi:hypothetical protein